MFDYFLFTFEIKMHIRLFLKLNKGYFEIFKLVYLTF